MVIKGGPLLYLLRVGGKQVVDKRLVVQDAMQVGAHATVVHPVSVRRAVRQPGQGQGRFSIGRKGLSHVYLVAFHLRHLVFQ